MTLDSQLFYVRSYVLKENKLIVLSFSLSHWSMIYVDSIYIDLKVNQVLPSAQGVILLISAHTEKAL